MSSSVRRLLALFLLAPTVAWAQDPATAAQPTPSGQDTTPPKVDEPAPSGTETPPSDAAGVPANPETAAPPSLDERLQTLEGKVEGMNESQSESKGILDALSKIKFSGYIQGRFEYHDDAAPGLNAKNAPTQTTQFLVRRGRLKTVYSGRYAEFLLQIDASSSGVVLKDAEATFIEPWTGENIRLTIGQFKWPFGYEVLQSSQNREMPERSLMIRRLFPGERDRGVRLQWTHDWLRFAFAVVNGNGTQDATFPANDQNAWKDVVGRLGVDFGNFVMGVSGYWGKTLVLKAAMPMAMPPVAASSQEFDKGRVGTDIETYIDVPHVGGLALKGELIYAKELGADALGFIVLAVQNIDDLGIFVRLDQYDPDINKDNDRTTTIGGGLQYFLSSNLKLSTVYEHPMLQGAADPSDDIFTVQMQAMF